MTDEQKAKHEFAMHQDRLYWSRMQFFAVVQAAVLTGIYSIRNELPVSIGLAVLGTVLSALVLLVMLRDDRLGTKAFEESGLSKTVSDGPLGLKGRHFAYAAFTLLLVLDWLLLFYCLTFRR